MPDLLAPVFVSAADSQTHPAPPRDPAIARGPAAQCAWALAGCSRTGPPRGGVDPRWDSHTTSSSTAGQFCRGAVSASSFARPSASNSARSRLTSSGLRRAKSASLPSLIASFQSADPGRMCRSCIVSLPGSIVGGVSLMSPPRPLKHLQTRSYSQKLPGHLSRSPNRVKERIVQRALSCRC